MGEYQRKFAARQRLARVLTPTEGVLALGGVKTRDLQFPNDPLVQRAIPAAVLIANGERAARKGKFDGNCNRTACQEPIKGNNWWNVGTRAYYCQRCAHLINEWPAQRGEALICFAVTEPAQ